MFSSYLLLLLLAIKLISTEETSVQDYTQSIFSNLPNINHEKTHRETRDYLLPKIRRMSLKMQSIINSTSIAFDRMQDLINPSCLPSTLILYIAQLSTNLTRIVQTEVPFIEQELEQIVPRMDKLQEEMEQLADDVKQQKVPLFNIEQLERLQKLTSAYHKLNDEARQLNRQLMQMMNETISPGVGLIDEYNKCLKSTALSLIDHNLDQIVEHIDDDDEELFSFDRFLMVKQPY